MTKRPNPTSISKTLRLILVCGLLLGMIGLMPVQAIPLPSEGPKRTVTLDLNYTTYEYWLLSWQTSQVVCQIYVEHESLPDPKEVLYFCGSNIQNQWLRTGPCLYEGSVNTPQDCRLSSLHVYSSFFNTPEYLQVRSRFVKIRGDSCYKKNPLLIL